MVLDSKHELSCWPPFLLFIPKLPALYISIVGLNSGLSQFQTHFDPKECIVLAFPRCLTNLIFMIYERKSQWESQASSQSFPDVGHAALRGLVTEAETLAQNRATKALESREQAAHQAVMNIPPHEILTKITYSHGATKWSSEGLFWCLIV